MKPEDAQYFDKLLVRYFTFYLLDLLWLSIVEKNSSILNFLVYKHSKVCYSGNYTDKRTFRF